MPVQTYATKDEIPKGWESDYEEKDGAFHFKDPGAAAASALAEERAKREAAEKLATKAAGELKKLEQKAKASEAGLTDEQLQKLRADVKAELEAEYAPKIADAEKHAAEVRSLKLDAAVKKVMGDHGVRAEKLEQAWKLAGDRFDLTADGKPMVKDSPGVPVEKYITDTLKQEIPEFYVGTQAAGGGAAGQQKGGSTTPPVIDVIANPGAALQAARAAGKTE